MGADARCASTQRPATGRPAALFVTVLVAGVLLGLVVHLLGALNQRSAAHDEGVALAATATGAVDPHAPLYATPHVAAPIAGSGLADGADRTSPGLATPLSHDHDDTACSSLLRPSGATALDISGCTDSVGVANGVAPAAIKIPAPADGPVPVARPTDSPGRQRI